MSFLQGRTLSAAEFRNHLHAGNAGVHLVKCVIQDDKARGEEDIINLRNLTVPQALICEDCTFESHVDCSDARFAKTLRLIECRFAESLTLRGAVIDGTFDISHSTIGLPRLAFEGAVMRINRHENPYEAPPPFRSARWDGLTVKGTLRACRLKVQGSLDLGNCVVRGSVILRGVEIGIPAKRHEEQTPVSTPDLGGRLYMRQARIDGDLELWPWFQDIKQGDTQWEIVGKRTEIRGNLSIGSSIIKGRFNMRGAKIHGCLHAIMVQISGRVLADCWIPPMDGAGDKSIRTEIGSMLETPGAKRRLETRGHTPDAESQRNISLYFQDCVIDAALWLQGIKTSGGLDFDNARIGGSLHLEVWNRASHQHKVVDLLNTDWHHILDEEDESALDHKEDHLHIYRSRIGRSSHGESVSVRNARIEANFYAMGIRTKGRIVAHNATIRSVFSCVPYSLRDGRFVRTWLGCDDSGKSLSFYGATFGMNVEFSGAWLEGAVRMRYAKVTGAIIGQQWLPEIKEKASFAETIRKKFPHASLGMSGKGHGLHLYGTTIEGNVCCDGITMRGILSLELATIKGSVVIRDCRIAAGNMWEVKTDNLPKAGIEMQRARVTNGVNFGGGSLIFMGVNMTGAHIGGDLKLDDGQDDPAAAHNHDRDPMRRRVRILPMIDCDERATPSAGPPISGLARVPERHRPGELVLEGGKIEGDLKAADLFVADRIHGKALVARDEVIMCGIIVGWMKDHGRLTTAYHDDYTSAWDSLFQIHDANPPRDFRRRTSVWMQPESEDAPVMDLSKISVGHDLKAPGGAFYGNISLSHGKVRGETLLPGQVAGFTDLCNFRAHGITLEFDEDSTFDAFALNGTDWKDRPENCDEPWYDYIYLKHAHTGEFEIKGKLPWVRRLAAEGFSFKKLKLDHAACEFRSEATYDSKKIPGKSWEQRGRWALAFFAFFIYCLAFGLSVQWPKSGQSWHLVWDEIVKHDNLLASTQGIIMHGFGLVFWSAYSALLFWVCIRFYMRSVSIRNPFHERNKGVHGSGPENIAGKRKKQCWVIFSCVAIDIACLLMLPFEMAESFPLFLLIAAGSMLVMFVLFRWLSGLISKDFYSRLIGFETNWQSEDQKEIGQVGKLLSCIVPFSQEPYLIASSNFEREGKREDASRIYYLMREREIARGVCSKVLKFFKWIFYVAAGSGAGVVPLVMFLLCYFTFSWLMVFSNPDSVEHPSTFLTHEGNDSGRQLNGWHERTGHPLNEGWSDQLKNGHVWPFYVAESHGSEHESGHTDKEPEWGMTDGFWMSLRVHVPLLHLFAKTKWEPASVKGTYYSAFGMRDFPFGMEYETYACIAQIMSYLTIPMLLTALGQFYRGQEHGGGHGHGHAHDDHDGKHH